MDELDRVHDAEHGCGGADAERDGENRRKGERGLTKKAARRIADVLDQRLFSKSADWLAFVPDGLQSFTTKDLATVAETNRELAQKMAYCLRQARMIELIGRRRRANLYRVAGA